MRDVSEAILCFEIDTIQHSKYSTMMGANSDIIERVSEIINNHGVIRGKIALTWLLHKNQIVALDVQLTLDEVKYLEELYVLHPLSEALTKSKIELLPIK